MSLMETIADGRMNVFVLQGSQDKISTLILFLSPVFVFFPTNQVINSLRSIVYDSNCVAFMFPLLRVSFCRLTDLSGSLTDGPFNYKYKTKCTWLIEGL